MITISRTFAVGAAPDAVLAYLRYPGNAGEWDATARRITHAGPGPLAVGSSRRKESRIAGILGRREAAA